MRHFARAAFAAAVTLGLAGTAIAAPAMDTPPPPGDASGPGGFPHGDITKADFMKKAEARFDRLDTNHDGILTEAEMKAGHDAWRRHDGEHRGPEGDGPR